MSDLDHELRSRFADLRAVDAGTVPMFKRPPLTANSPVRRRPTVVWWLAAAALLLVAGGVVVQRARSRAVTPVEPVDVTTITNWTPPTDHLLQMSRRALEPPTFAESSLGSVKGD